LRNLLQINIKHFQFFMLNYTLIL